MFRIRAASIGTYLGVLTVVAVLPALVLIIHAGREQRRDAIVQAEHQMTILVRSMVEHQEGEIKAARQTLKTLVQTEAVQSQDPTACKQLFHEIICHSSNLLNITLCNKSGQVVASARPFNAISLADRKHFRDALQKKSFSAGEFIFTRLGDTEPAFPFALPVRNSHNQVKGVLTIVLAVSSFTNLLEHASLPQGSFIAVTDHHGLRLFYHPENSETHPIGQPIAAESWQAAQQARDPGLVSAVASDGRVKRLAFYPMYLNSQTTPYLFMWAGIPEQQILAPANLEWKINLSVMAVVILFSVLLARFFGQYTLVKPLAALAQASHNFGQDQPWQLPSQYCQPAEIEQLSATFTTMTQRLENSRAIQLQSEQRLEHLATHDELTGLANRTLLLDRLDHAIEEGMRQHHAVAVLLIDLDRFQVINDSLGHDQGDRLLCQIGKRLCQHVRSTDTVSRLGGDEFALVLGDLNNEESLIPLMQDLLKEISSPCHIDNHHIVVTASIGISLFPNDGNDSITLLRNADLAMYQSKRHKGDFTFYSSDMNQHAVKILELEKDLRQALERGELLLHYQPKVSLQSGKIVGCEALIRWQHPLRGLVSPADFIPLAEETGLIVPIGTWVLEQACQQAISWQQQQLPTITMAVNLSSRQFRHGNLCDVVDTILETTTLHPDLLDLEITESMIMDDPEGAVQTMIALKERGVLLSLDDFGTGYSSLNYLRRFPVDCLKIDASFIRDVAQDSSSAAVAVSIVDIAHHLGLTTVAEGVETVEQLDFLEKCHCDILQGYLYSRPLPAEDFTSLLRSNLDLKQTLSKKPDRV
ncbi:EAL domain-containing protein [Desulfuromonas acetoxidans]|uniref:Diguanylate cyclase/phosphodiesterase n=1 Tax=Desulfuromonas acetoxidans (strain DSM 684 / 11070) TaxID=281689 RepID=Q1JZ20_DESA6|nr:EAL domain-containing protein [Desulfuromonas acetoxidans]EAT15474.1 diguanylate cyclase/phosphodiesterase [Desulfuromonas acetoxidans DSM 684]MBF0646659.1 EAL domain-containing protein [Desulfuromonas acetoxidans]NVD25762.1 EAL domain-containing protein [Desulfuromonas acetoxidans]NVE17740.1 EAL domain-containing protein [Desulfuromonas acetoxidans]